LSLREKEPDEAEIEELTVGDIEDDGLGT